MDRPELPTHPVSRDHPGPEIGRRGAAMPPVGSLRAADADREWVAGQLREHLADGRLELEECVQRMERAYASRTLADLEETLVDLPHAPVSVRLLTARQSAVTPPAGGLRQRHRRAVVLQWSLIPLVLILALAVAWSLWPGGLLLLLCGVGFAIRGRRARSGVRHAWPSR